MSGVLIVDQMLNRRRICRLDQIEGRSNVVPSHPHFIASDQVDIFDVSITDEAFVVSCKRIHSDDRTVAARVYLAARIRRVVPKEPNQVVELRRNCFDLVPLEIPHRPICSLPFCDRRFDFSKLPEQQICF